MSLDLFLTSDANKPEHLTADTVLLSSYVLSASEWIYAEIAALAQQSPFRTMLTPAGQMSVATTSWGPLGWTSDANGYRYTHIDPLTQAAWPSMPSALKSLASKAAELAGYINFEPDSCLVNCYTPEAKMGLHQDKNERDYSQPIVSFSLGLAATFLMGGLTRSDPVFNLRLNHGDVLVFGRADRLRFHGVSAVAEPLLNSPMTTRFNLTFRRVA